MIQITNATKALVISLVNAGLGLLVAFGVSFTDAQIAAILGFGNAVLAAVVAVTYKSSPKRIPGS